MQNPAGFGEGKVQLQVSDVQPQMSPLSFDVTGGGGGIGPVYKTKLELKCITGYDTVFLCDKEIF